MKLDEALEFTSFRSSKEVASFQVITLAHRNRVSYTRILRVYLGLTYKIKSLLNRLCGSDHVDEENKTSPSIYARRNWTLDWCLY